VAEVPHVFHTWPFDTKPSLETRRRIGVPLPFIDDRLGEHALVGK
jgi:hypothetical protein